MPQEVEKTYKILEGELEGIFQLESSGMRQIVRPEALLHRRYFLNSGIYRPGPLDAGLILSLSIASMVEKR